MREDTGQRKDIYLIGDPVEHSVSPQMHNAAFAHLSLRYMYDLMQVKPEDLENAVDELRASHIQGFNVTVPHKEAIIKYLDGMDKLSTKIGAVNTVYNKEGRLYGYNTDAQGFMESLTTDAGIDPKRKKVLILGAGGAARAIAVALTQAKAGQVTVFDTDEAKAQALVAHLQKEFPKRPAFLVHGKDELNEAVRKSHVVINATPVGMSPNVDESPLGDDVPLSSKQLVYDLVYNPAETKLMKMAAAKGAKAVSGLGMLVRQGAAALKIFTKYDGPIDIMMNAAKESLGFVLPPQPEAPKEEAAETPVETPEEKTAPEA